MTVAPLKIEDAEAKKQEGPPETAATYTVGGGFGAVQGQIPGAESLGCFVDVDVANGQTLEASLMSWDSSRSMSNQDMCAKTKQAAEFAVTNLQAQG